MTMKNEPLKHAFRDAASIEFNNIPMFDADIDYIFSVGFETKTQKLVKRRKNYFWHMVNTTRKRVAIVALAILILMTTACGFPKVRERIVKMVSNNEDTFIEYSFEGETTNEILHTYYLSEIPDGFSETDSSSSVARNYTVYRNSNDDVIKFSQSITGSIALSVDNEHGKTKEINVSGNTVYLYSAYETHIAMWTYNGYFLEIVVYGDYDESFIISLVESVTCLKINK